MEIGNQLVGECNFNLFVRVLATNAYTLYNHKGAVSSMEERSRRDYNLAVPWPRAFEFQRFESRNGAALAMHTDRLPSQHRG